MRCREPMCVTTVTVEQVLGKVEKELKIQS
jgi:hypothetical protein